MGDSVPQVQRRGRGRTKKLTEVARWHFLGEYDKRKRLVSGAAFCVKCRARSNSFAAETGRHEFAGKCFETKAGDGECVNPCPPLAPANSGVWNLFNRTLGATNFRGMDGVPAGTHLCCVESAARALLIDWNEATLKKFQLIEGMRLQEVARQIDERNAKNKLPKGMRNG